jgi:hypothetical protein
VRIATLGTPEQRKARTNGALLCWDEHTVREIDGPGSDIQHLAHGGGTLASTDERYACALRLDGSIACWGSNADGTAMPPEGHFSLVATGEHFACALARDQSTHCWDAFRDIVSGWGFSCGLRTLGWVSCGGDPDNDGL